MQRAEYATIDHMIASLSGDVDATITEQEIEQLCSKAIEIFQTENNCTPVPAPVTVVGDVHGQFYDQSKATAQAPLPSIPSSISTRAGLNHHVQFLHRS